LGTNNVLIPQLFGRGFQKTRNFTAISIIVTRTQDLASALTAGGGDPLSHPTPSPAFNRARGEALRCWDPNLGSLNFSAVVVPLAGGGGGGVKSTAV